MRSFNIMKDRFILPLLVVLMLTPAAVLGQQDLSSFPSNTRFDPDAADRMESSSCTIPPYQDGVQNFLPVPDGYCPAPDAAASASSLTDLTEAQLDALALEYAPVLFYHPLERYTMASVDFTFADPQAGRIIFEDGASGFEQVFDESLNQTSLLLSTRDRNLGINSQKYYFEHELNVQYVAGAGFDASGKSRAPIYYSAFPWEDGTWVFAYHFYYTVNGYGNLGVATSSNDTFSYTRFTAGPYDGHEGDWESVSVMVCPSAVATQPIAVSYKQQQWAQVTDCTAGECTMYKDSTHPVGFVALNNHATYPMTSKEIVIQPLEADFFVDLQGVLAIDRTLYHDNNGDVRFFEPNANNVLRIKDQDEIELGVSNPLEYWQGFGGTWGSTALLPDQNDTLTCFNSNQTAVIECPTEEEDPVFYLVLQLLGIKGGGSYLVKAASLLVDSVDSVYPNTGKSPRGPPAELTYTRWATAKNAPIWNDIASNTTAAELCKALVVVTDVTRLSPIVASVPLVDNVLYVIFFCVLVMLVNILCYSIQECCRKPWAAWKFDEDCALVKPTRRDIAYLWRPTFFYTLFYAVTMAGILMVLTGYSAVFDITEQYLGTNFGSVANWVFTFAVLIAIIDSIFLVLIWVTTHDILLCQYMEAYYRMIGDEEMTEHWEKRRWSRCIPVSGTFFHFMRAVLFSSLIMAAVVTVFGCFNVGFAYGLGQICAGVVGAVNGFCFELDVLGIESIPCGTEFQSFCDVFSNTETIVVLWGSFVTIAGHFYLISSAGAATLQLKAFQGTLFLLPTVSQYQDELNQSNIARLESDELAELELEESGALAVEKDDPANDVNCDGGSPDDDPADEVNGNPVKPDVR